MAAVLPYLPYIIGGVASAIGGLSGSDAAKNNAKAAKAEGVTAAQAGELKAGQIARNNRLLTEQQFAGYAASGVSPTSGSPLDVMTQDAVQGELDALMAQYEGRAAQQSLNYEAKQYKFQGKQDLLKGVLLGPVSELGKGAGYRESRKVAPTIQPGGGASSAQPGSLAGYNAPSLNAQDIFR